MKQCQIGKTAMLLVGFCWEEDCVPTGVLRIRRSFCAYSISSWNQMNRQNWIKINQCYVKISYNRITSIFTHSIWFFFFFFTKIWYKYFKQKIIDKRNLLKLYKHLLSWTDSNEICRLTQARPSYVCDLNELKAHHSSKWSKKYYLVQSIFLFLSSPTTHISDSCKIRTYNATSLVLSFL